MPQPSRHVRKHRSETVRVYRSRRRDPWLLWLVAAIAATTLGVALAAGSGEDGSAREPSGGRVPSAAVSPDATPDPTPSATPAPPAPIRRLRLGRGARAVVVAYRGELDQERPAVVLLHGWGVPISDYDEWADHLVRLGETVILPRYQTSPRARPDGVRTAAVAGLRRALRSIRVRPRTLVIAGHSAGAALAADLAATAAAGGGLPDPVAIFAAYPGRAILGYPGGIPARSLSGLPSSTRLTVLGSPTDAVVGEGPARALANAAVTLPSSRRRYVRVGDPRVADHFAPTRSSGAVRRTFWRRLDRLAVAAREDAAG